MNENGFILWRRALRQFLLVHYRIKRMKKERETNDGTCSGQSFADHSDNMLLEKEKEKIFEEIIQLDPFRFL